MTFGEMKELIRSYLPNRYDNLQISDATLRLMVHRALKRIAKETVPLKLVVNDITGLTVIRKVDDQTYIRYPIIPYGDDSDIDIDEELVEAVAAHVCSELEPQRKGHYLQQYEREIRQNNDRLIETDLDECTNGGKESWL